MRKTSHMQIQALDLWIEGGCKSKAEAIRAAGYGESIARQPHKVFDSPAVLDELDKRGLNAQGIRIPVRAIEFDPAPPELPQPVPDFSKMSKESLQDLKESLAYTPTPAQSPVPLEENNYAYLLEGLAINALRDQMEEGEQGSRGENYSSM